MTSGSKKLDLGHMGKMYQGIGLEPKLQFPQIGGPNFSFESN